jgi:hypothetical protein
MKKILLIVAGLIAASTLTVSAQEATKKKQRTPEQKACWKEMVTKYDTNSDKKLDKDELAKVSADDKKKMEDAKVWPKERKGKKAA